MAKTFSRLKKENLEIMSHVLQYRGPDENGIHICNNCALSNTRLTNDEFL